MILDEKFNRVAVVSLPRSKDRAVSCLQQLHERNLSEKAEVFRAIDGKICPASSWWVSGNSSWGCMMSHFRVVQDALMDGIETLLVLEDDCVWQEGADRLVAEFLEQVPDDWGQIYFGGQHRNGVKPTCIPGKPAVWVPNSVHRTHAYAIHRRAMVKFLQHIIYAPDYINAKIKNGIARHVDHQLEQAHQRGDWKVYCPSWWLAGQSENLSLISGKKLGEQWWHTVKESEFESLPLVIVDKYTPTEDQQRHLHFGKLLLKNDAASNAGIYDTKSGIVLLEIMKKIASQAGSGQRLPAINCDAKTEHTQYVIDNWGGTVVQLEQHTNLKELCSYHKSKVMYHPWWNPKN
jgi:hypothetical protein